MVWLDAGSTLRYPDGFTDDTRIVSLSGEAYFSVASDSSKLFLVQAEHAAPQALADHAYPLESAHDQTGQGRC